MIQPVYPGLIVAPSPLLNTIIRSFNANDYQSLPVHFIPLSNSISQEMACFGLTVEVDRRQE